MNSNEFPNITIVATVGLEVEVTCELCFTAAIFGGPVTIPIVVSWAENHTCSSRNQATLDCDHDSEGVCPGCGIWVTKWTPIRPEIATAYIAGLRRILGNEYLNSDGTVGRG